MTEQPENHGATTKASPPPYEVYTPNRGNRLSPAPNSHNQQQPEPATNGRVFREDVHLQVIKFFFSPNPSISWSAQDWGAVLFVNCSDVPRLMREGLYWDTDNVIKRDGYVRPNPNLYNSSFRQDGKLWVGIRYYFLRDLQRPPRWTASIEVYSSSYRALYRFDLSQLSRKKIISGVALNQSRELIYEYHHGQPQRCYNAIYNKMPMKGQWPWPRE